MGMGLLELFDCCLGLVENILREIGVYTALADPVAGDVVFFDEVFQEMVCLEFEFGDGRG